MPPMRKLLILAAFVTALGACDKQDRFDEVLGEMEGFKSRMCACTDKACTDDVQDAWREYRKTLRDKVGEEAKPSDAQDKRGRALEEELRTCRRTHDPAPPADTP
jgi:hypothetical protein